MGYQHYLGFVVCAAICALSFLQDFLIVRWASLILHAFFFFNLKILCNTLKISDQYLRRILVIHL